jgi:hypothetical protein
MGDENGESNQCNDGKTHDGLHLRLVGMLQEFTPKRSATLCELLHILINYSMQAPMPPPDMRCGDTIPALSPPIAPSKNESNLRRKSYRTACNFRS